MKLTVKSLVNWKFFLLAIVLAGGLVFFSSHQVAHAQSDCIDPATGQQCTPTPGPTCGLPGLPPCEPPPSKPDPTRTPRPRPSNTPLPTATYTTTPTTTASATPMATATPFPTLGPTATPQPTPTLRSSITGLITTVKNNALKKPSPFIRWVLSEGNLITITNAEITQAIQCLDNPNCPDNSVPLVTGKQTLVRVYAKIPDESKFTILTNISGAICPGNTGSKGCSNPIRPVNKFHVRKYPFKDQREYLSDTLNFLLPNEWLSKPGYKEFTVYVNYNLEDRPFESVYNDNHFLIQTDVRQSQPLGIRFVPVQDHGVMADTNSTWTSMAYIQAAYPTRIFKWYIWGGALLSKNYEWNVDQGTCDKGFNSLLSDLKVVRGPYKEIYYGLVPETGFSKVTGSSVIGCGAYPNEFVGGGLSSPISQSSQKSNPTYLLQLTSHEVGHNSGLPHTPGCDAGDPDTTFPNNNGMLDEVGVNVTKMKIYPPSSSWDFMSYCGTRAEANTWISRHNTLKLLDALPKGVFEPRQLAALEPVGLANTPEQVLVASGYIDPQQVGFNGGFITTEGSNAPEVTSNDGEYVVALLDGKGKEVYTQNFATAIGEAIGTGEDTPVEGGSFVLVLPWQEGVKEVVFSHQGTELGRVKASKNSPTVTFTNPVGGETWGASGKQTVSWQAEDKDGDPLTYTLQISRDNGTTWDTMNPNMTETSLQYDTSFVAGADQAIFRILASDGLNTSEAISQPIRIENKVPLLNIEGPLEGTQVEQGNAILLYAQAVDLQDGSLDSSAFTWSSDCDGTLGTGDQLVVQDVSLGVHMLTVDVVNKAGLHSQQSVKIEVIPAQRVQVEYDSVTISPILWVMLVLGVAIAGLLVVFVIVWRKARK